MRVRRWSGIRTGDAAFDDVAREEPLELRVNGQPVAVIMRTPGNDEELAAGFLLTEGVIRRREDLFSTRHNPRNHDGNVLEVFLADGVRVDLARLTRHVFGASSCGLCGKATIKAIRTRFPPVRSALRLTAETLLSMPDRLRQGQSLFGRTGGLHAAGLFEADGSLVDLSEDVGRHNAVDKLLGRALLNDRLPLDTTLLLVSGRVSFEIVQKALAAGIPVVAAVGAPSSLAVEFARSAGQSLVGFLRDGRFNLYTDRRRITARLPS